MSPSPRHPRRPRRPSIPPARRASSTRRATTDPTRQLDLDESRFLAFRSGVSPAEIAARENSTLAAVESSLARQRILREQFSQESLEHIYRRGAIDAHSAVQSAILQALGAVHTQIKEVGKDADGNPVTEIFTFPDHKTRLSAIGRLKDLVASLQAQAPLLSLTQNTLNQQNLQLAPGQVSIESIIRQVRIEKGLVPPSETQPLLDAETGQEILPDRVDFELERELALARAEGMIINEDDGEILDAEDGEEEEDAEDSGPDEEVPKADKS